VITRAIYEAADAIDAPAESVRRALAVVLRAMAESGASIAQVEQVLSRGKRTAKT
jgi:hypothetical protein